MPAKYQTKSHSEKEIDESYYLLKCDDQYLSILLLPFSLYDKLSDLLIQEDIDYFWGLHTTSLNGEAYIVMRDQMFRAWGKKVSLKGTEWTFWLLGSVPEQLLPYLKAIK